MAKRAFTLIELMVSIALTSIVVIFLYKALSSQEISNKVLTKNFLQTSTKNAIFSLIYTDFLQAKSIKIKPTFNKSFFIVHLQTSNSLHQIPLPYVTYYVNDKNQTLIRLESAYPISFPVGIENVKYIFADSLISNVEKFEIIQKGVTNSQNSLPGVKKNNTTQKNYLIFLKSKDGSMLFNVKIF